MTSIDTVELCSANIRVRPATRELEIDGQSVAVERRAFDLLVYLMQNPGRVVDKDELLRAVWRSRPVSESTVAQAVSKIRQALGGETEEWVATVYGVGYRFVAAVAVIEQPAPTTDKPQADNVGYRKRARQIAVPVFAIALVALLMAWIRWEEPQDAELRIAVLPVQNETGDARLDWVELGVLPLIDSVLEDGGVRRVDTRQVLSTIGRYSEAADPASQARVLKLNTSVDRVLIPRLFLADGGYRLEVSYVDSTSEAPDMVLQGADIPVLAVAAGQTLSESLSRWQGAERAQRGLVTDDPFVNQAFARGLDARLRGQWEEAARFFDTVLAAAPELLQAKYHLTIVTRRMGDWDYTEQLYTELMEAARASNDRRMMATVQQSAGILAWRRGDIERAGELYEQALSVFLELGIESHIASAYGNLGILAATSGNFALAEERMLTALTHYMITGDRYNEAQTLKNIGQLLIDQGRPDASAEQLQKSLEIRRTLELPLEVAMTMNSLAEIDMARGHWPLALVKYKAVVKAAQEYHSPVMEARAYGDLSKVLCRLGRLEQARQFAADAQRIATELGSPTNQAFALLQQGRAEHHLSHWQRAVELFSQSFDLYNDIDQPLGAELARIAKIESLIAAGRTDEAAELLDASVARVENSELKRLHAPLARARALLAEQRGDQDAALAAQREAYRMASAHEELIEQLDFGGELGLMLLRSEPDAAELVSLVKQLTPRAEASAGALAFLTRYHRDRDPERALAWARSRRSLVGEGWTTADERELQDLMNRLL